MSTFSCDDKATLVAYLYGEVDAATRAGIETHLATCEACAQDVTALGDVRAELGLWVPPDAELGFAIVKKSEPTATVLRPARWWSTVPAWAQAAAAVLVLAAGAAVANIQVRSDANGLVVTTGWMRPALGEPFDGAAVERRVEGRVEQALTTLEQQLRHEIQAARTQDAARVAARPADEATIRRVQQLLAESEQRQERTLALRLTQFTRDMNMQRRADLMRITNSLGTMEGQVLRNRQYINNVVRASVVPPQ
jgi:anti-sigma factor RsiW